MDSRNKNNKNLAEVIATEADLNVMAHAADVKRLNKVVKESRSSLNPLLFQETTQLRKQLKKQDKAIKYADKLNGIEIDRDDPMYDQQRKPGASK